MNCIKQGPPPKMSTGGFIILVLIFIARPPPAPSVAGLPLFFWICIEVIMFKIGITIREING